MKELFNVQNRVAFVSGATGYLGKEMVLCLAKAGAHVIINSRHQDQLEKLSAELSELSLKSTIACFDVTDDSRTDVLLKILEKFERLDILINNAYSGKPGTVQSATQEDFLLAYKSAVTGPFNLIQRSMKYLLAAANNNSGGASIINISSMYGQVSPDPSIYGDSGLNNPPFYGAAKSGLQQLTRYLACHLANEKIRVNSISPGAFPPTESSLRQPDFINNLKKKIPLGRVGAAHELSGAILFLASDASSYVTGANIPVDGGWTAW